MTLERCPSPPPSIQLSQFTWRIPRMPLVELILSLQYFHPLLTFPSPLLFLTFLHGSLSISLTAPSCPHFSLFQFLAVTVPDTWILALLVVAVVPVFFSRRCTRSPSFLAVTVPGVPVRLSSRQLPTQAVCSSLRRRKIVLDILEVQKTQAS